MHAAITEPRVDVVFALSGTAVPRDHGYALFGAIARVVGDLHGAEWLAVPPLAGTPRPDGLLQLHPRRAALRLRVVPSEIPRILPLAGKQLDVDGCKLRLGVPNVYALTAAPTLEARIVVIKKFLEQGPFGEAVSRQLAELGVHAEVEVGKRRVLTISGDRVVGFATTLRGLSEEASLAVQYAGVGGRQRMGCGVFLPVLEKRL